METYQDIKKAQAELNHLSEQFEEMMVEGGGEVTDETENLDKQKTAISGLLAGEGIDILGRIIKGKEDRMFLDVSID